MAKQKQLSLAQQQRITKPLIEDVIPEYLDGDMKKSALDFVAYLRKNRMSPSFARIANAWHNSYKGTGLYTIWICTKGSKDPYGKPRKWAINPYLKHISHYEDIILQEGLQHFIWNNVRPCKHHVTGDCNFHGCAPGTNKTILGKEFKNVCIAHMHIGRPLMVAHDPDEATIDCIKRLLELERKARVENYVSSAKRK